MSDLDLDAMTLPELKKLQTRVATAIRTYEERQKKAALAEVEAKAAEMGFTLAELASFVGKKGKVHPPKYRNPEDPEQTWSGRGRKPAWIKDAIENGQDIDSFMIAS